MDRRARIALAAAAVALGSAAPLVAQRPSLAMLDQLEDGNWELRTRDRSGSVERFCMRDARRLIQLRHPTENCERLVVTDAPGEVTVQYTCRGKGYGRTQIRRESNTLVQIDTQGIADGLPFAFAAEARKIGNCTA